jgi:methionyl-tRNA formyltransferase
MGTPSFAVPSLRALLVSRHPVAGVVTQPDRPAGRGLLIRIPPVKEIALERCLPVLQPARIKSPGLLDEIRSLRPDVLVVVAYGRILPPSILGVTPYGGVNVHASLLPRYRGAAPVAWAIASGETVTGVTTMRMAEKLDAGDILLQRSTSIRPDETAGDLEERLSEMGARLLIDTLDAFSESTLAYLPQNDQEATFAPSLKKEDAKIDWTMTADAIARRVLAFNPWPVAFTLVRGKGMRLFRARAIGGEDSSPSAPGGPGEVLRAGPDGVRVRCGGGTVLDLLEVQPDGRRRISAAMASAGRYFSVGDVLG